MYLWNNIWVSDMSVILIDNKYLIISLFVDKEDSWLRWENILKIFEFFRSSRVQQQQLQQSVGIK